MAVSFKVVLSNFKARRFPQCVVQCHLSLFDPKVLVNAGEKFEVEAIYALYYYYYFLGKMTSVVSSSKILEGTHTPLPKTLQPVHHLLIVQSGLATNHIMSALIQRCGMQRTERRLFGHKRLDCRQCRIPGTVGHHLFLTKIRSSLRISSLLPGSIS